MKEIWLNKDNVDKAYLFAGRKALKQTNMSLLDELENINFKQDWIEKYRKDMIFYIKEKHKTNNLFPVEYSKDILKVLKKIDNKKEFLKRVLSITCFGDSKYFEKNLEHIIVRIIKKYLLENDIQEDTTNEDILLEVGISKYPEILEFCGDLEYYINNEKIEYKKITMRKLYK